MWNSVRLCCRGLMGGVVRVVVGGVEGFIL